MSHCNLEEEEEEENLFAKKAGCQKGLQPINVGYDNTIIQEYTKYTQTLRAETTKSKSSI